MRFLREIPAVNINDNVINDLSNYGFVLVWKEDSVEVWAESTESV